MATIDQTGAGARNRKGFSRYRLAALRIDMTPMVDLGFLLIAFFVMTAELSRPATMHLNMPKVENAKPTPTRESTTLTVLIGEDGHLFYYHGSLVSQLQTTSFSPKDGLRKIIIDKQAELSRTGMRDEMMLVIKPCAGATYKNLIDALDEATINGLKRYVVVSPGREELDLVP